MHTRTQPPVDTGSSINVITHTCIQREVIITTSPASDHPRTELLEKVLATFRFVNGLAGCRTIIVCDGYKCAASCNFRGGKVDDVRRANYEGYKEALRAKVALAGWEHVELLELEQHHGFGYAVREALPLVDTDYVCVVQHDRTFMRTVNLASVVRGMDAHPERVGYVLLPTSSTGTGRQYTHNQRSRLGQMGYRDCDLDALALALDAGSRLVPCIQWVSADRKVWAMHCAERKRERERERGER